MSHCILLIHPHYVKEPGATKRQHAVWQLYSSASSYLVTASVCEELGQ